MPDQSCCVESKAKSRVTFGEVEEGIAEVVGVQDARIVFNNIGHIHKNLLISQMRPDGRLYNKHCDWTPNVNIWVLEEGGTEIWKH